MPDAVPNPHPSRAALTPTQRDVLRLLASGLTDQAVAARLGLTDRTVRRRLAEAMAILGARSRFQAGFETGRLEFGSPPYTVLACSDQAKHEGVTAARAESRITTPEQLAVLTDAVAAWSLGLATGGTP